MPPNIHMPRNMGGARGGNKFLLLLQFGSRVGNCFPSPIGRAAYAAQFYGRRHHKLLSTSFDQYGNYESEGIGTDDVVDVLPDGGISNDLSVSTSSTHAPSSSPSSFPSAPIIMGVILITTFFVFVRMDSGYISSEARCVSSLRTLPYHTTCDLIRFPSVSNERRSKMTSQTVGITRSSTKSTKQQVFAGDMVCSKH